MEWSAKVDQKSRVNMILAERRLSMKTDMTTILIWKLANLFCSFHWKNWTFGFENQRLDKMYLKQDKSGQKNSIKKSCHSQKVLTKKHNLIES